MSNDYEYSEEYRERFGFNKGERYWISEAFNFYKDHVQEELNGEIEQGLNPFIHPDYFNQLFKDLDGKLDMWMKEEHKHLKEEEE